MKKIVILQIPNANNNGSAMMAINAIDFFDRHFESDIEFYCDFSTESDKHRVISELRAGTKVSKLLLPKFKRGPNIISSFFNRMCWIKEVIRVIGEQKPMAIVVLGGDDFSEYYSGYKIIVRLYLMYRLSHHFPIYLIGHTIGPFKSWRKLAFKFLMSRCRIITRDAISVEHCQKDLKHKNCSQGHDLAWFDLPNQSMKLKEELLARYALQEGRFVVVIPSALVNHYAKSEEDYFSSWKKILKELVGDGYQVVMMPHVFSEFKRDDRWAIAEICSQVSDMSGIVYVHEMLLPSECRAIVSASRFSIACRMHAAVSTLQVGKPTIALSYSAKYAGVIGGDMRLPELVIEAAEKALWRGEITKQVLDKVKFVESNYESLRRRIVDRVDAIKVEQTGIMTDYSRFMLEKH